MTTYRLRSLALACLLLPWFASPALTQTQPAPSAKTTGGQVQSQPSSIFIAPAGGGSGPGKVLALDFGLPVQGRDSGTGLACTIGSSATCQMPGVGGGGGGGAVTGAVGAFVDGSDVTQGAKADPAWSAGSGSVVALLKAVANGSLSTASSAVMGQTAIGGPLTEPPVVAGCRVSVINQTQVADGSVQAMRCGPRGGLIVSPHGQRELFGDQSSVITASTAAATCVTAGGVGVLRDILSITAVNTSATGTEIQLLDDDGVTVRWYGIVPPTDMRGIVLPVVLKQPVANLTWKCKTVTAVTSVKFTIQFVNN